MIDKEIENIKQILLKQFQSKKDDDTITYF